MIHAMPPLLRAVKPQSMAWMSCEACEPSGACRPQSWRCWINSSLMGSRRTSASSPSTGSDSCPTRSSRGASTAMPPASRSPDGAHQRAMWRISPINSSSSSVGMHDRVSDASLVCVWACYLDGWVSVAYPRPPCRQDVELPDGNLVTLSTAAWNCGEILFDPAVRGTPRARIPPDSPMIPQIPLLSETHQGPHSSPMYCSPTCCWPGGW